MYRQNSVEPVKVLPWWAVRERFKRWERVLEVERLRKLTERPCLSCNRAIVDCDVYRASAGHWNDRGTYYAHGGFGKRLCTERTRLPYASQVACGSE